jgi:hypothetical protein
MWDQKPVDGKALLLLLLQSQAISDFLVLLDYYNTATKDLQSNFSKISMGGGITVVIIIK